MMNGIGPSRTGKLLRRAYWGEVAQVLIAVAVVIIGTLVAAF